MQNTNTLLFAQKVEEMLAETNCSDIDFIVHSNDNVVLTLVDEAKGCRVFQIRNFGEYLTFEESSVNRMWAYEREASIEALCQTLKSYVII